MASVWTCVGDIKSSKGLWLLKVSYLNCWSHLLHPSVFWHSGLGEKLKDLQSRISYFDYICIGGLTTALQCYKDIMSSWSPKCPLSTLISLATYHLPSVCLLLFTFSALCLFFCLYLQVCAGQLAYLLSPSSRPCKWYVRQMHCRHLCVR